MLTPPAIPGFTFAKTDYENLVTRYLAIPGYTSELLGYSVNGRPIYGFSYGDMTKPIMYVQGGIHGWHEWRTGWWVSEFMKKLSDPAGLPAATQQAIIGLKERYSFYFIPTVHPDGYGTAAMNGPYANANGVSISENFDYNFSWGVHTPPNDEYRGPYAFSEPESQIVRDKVLELRPVSLLCNHTWSATTVGYTTRKPRNSGDEPAILGFFDAINTALGYDETYNAKLSDSLPTGSAYNWSSQQDSTAGRKIIGQVWESGGGMTVEDQSRVGMTGILYHMLMVDDMLPDPDPEPGGDKPIVLPSAWGPIKVDGQTCAVASVDTYVSGSLARIWPQD